MALERLGAGAEEAGCRGGWGRLAPDLALVPSILPISGGAAFGGSGFLPNAFGGISGSGGRLPGSRDAFDSASFKASFKGFEGSRDAPKSGGCCIPDALELPELPDPPLPGTPHWNNRTGTPALVAAATGASGTGRCMNNRTGGTTALSELPLPPSECSGTTALVAAARLTATFGAAISSFSS